MQEVDRTRRIAELVKRELMALIFRRINDDRIKQVTITAVTVSRDLKHSSVYFSSLEQKKHTPSQLVKLLNKSAPYLKRLLSKNLNLRVTPSLVFKYDDSLKRGAEISPLLYKLTRKNGESD